MNGTTVNGSGAPGADFPKNTTLSGTKTGTETDGSSDGLSHLYGRSNSSTRYKGAVSRGKKKKGGI